MPRRIRNSAKRSPRKKFNEDTNVIQLPAFIKEKRQRHSPSFSEDHPYPPKIKRVELLPRSLAQEDYVEALQDKTKHIVIATGCAGTGKTLLCTLYAIQQLQLGNIDHIVITRPAVGVDDEEHGFLPGDLTAKLMPWCLPIVDIFKDYYSLPAINRMIEHSTLEFLPVSFVRGRTFKNTIAIFDEAQNSLPTAMKALLTRIGENSRILVTGDMEQSDRGRVKNGLEDFIDRLKATNSDMIAHCEFTYKDIERHPCVAEVLRLYKEE